MAAAVRSPDRGSSGLYAASSVPSLRFNAIHVFTKLASCSSRLRSGYARGTRIRIGPARQRVRRVAERPGGATLGRQRHGIRLGGRRVEQRLDILIASMTARGSSSRSSPLSTAHPGLRSQGASSANGIQVTVLLAVGRRRTTNARVSSDTNPRREPRAAGSSSRPRPTSHAQYPSASCFATAAIDGHEGETHPHLARQPMRELDVEPHEVARPD